jgi:hypothetical protein
MQAGRSEDNFHHQAVVLIRRALEICDILDYYEAACHLQMGLDMIDDPEMFRRIMNSRKKLLSLP